MLATQASRANAVANVKIKTGRAEAFADHLAYADAGVIERRFGAAVAAVAVAIALVAAPFAKVPLPHIAAFLPAVTGMTTLALVITGVLLATQYTAVRHPPLAILAFGYLSCAAVIVVYLLTYPGIFTPNGLLGAGPQTAAWLYVSFHVFLLLAVMGSLFAEPLHDESTKRVRAWLAPGMIVAGFIIAAVTFAVIHFSAALPGIVGARTRTPFWSDVFLAAFAAVTAALVALFYARTQFKKVIHLWTAVVLIASASETLLFGVLSGVRDSVGWYVGRAEWVIVSCAFLVVLLVHINRILVALTRGNRVLLQQTMSDSLTGLLNRRAFDLELFNGVRRARANRSAFSLLVIDIDDFKAYNDGFGHPAGDVALQSVAAAMLSAVARPDDACCRIGGEELAVVLPETTLDGATAVAERIRRSVENLRIAHGDGAPGAVTVSIGAASTDTARATGAMELFEAADRALYEAKQRGKNRVIVAP